MKSIMLIAVSLLITACGGSEEVVSESVLPEGHPALPASAAAMPSPDVVTGEVLETMDSGGYTYARLAVNDEEIWVAGPESPLEVGQSVTIADGTSMVDFPSTSLGRTFDEIFFVGGFHEGESQPLGPSQPFSAPPAMEMPAGGASGEALDVVYGGGYAYVQVKVEDEVIWVAGQGTEVKKGETIAWSGAVEMGDFHSPTLDRTFENVSFVSQLMVVR